MTITFYDFQPAPSPRKARMILAEKNIPHEVRQINLMTGEHKSDDYLAVNPAATLPALVLEDGTVLTDNLGIAAWAEEAFPAPPLMGEGAAARGLVMSEVSWIDMNGGIAFMEAYRNSHPKMAGKALPGMIAYEQIPQLAERGFSRLKLFLDDMENKLDGKDYLVTDSFTLADIWAFCFTGVMPWIKVGPERDSHPNIAAWQDRIAARDSAKL